MIWPEMSELFDDVLRLPERQSATPRPHNYFFDIDYLLSEAGLVGLDEVVQTLAK